MAQQRNKGLSKGDKPIPKEESPFNNFYYRDIAKLTGAGGWSVNFVEKKSFIDPQGRKILNTPNDYRPSIRTGLVFYADEDKQKASEIFYACGMGKPFSTTLRMKTFDGKLFWAKAVGRPQYDEEGAICGIQGVFQDINEEKIKEMDLEASLKIIESQNSRLYNFAHIVSHNLRSHASNLFLTLELIKTIESPEEEESLKKGLFEISGSLNDTINHLNEIVTSQTKSLGTKRFVKFDVVLQNVLSSINVMVEKSGAEIFSDFSEVPEIEYVPSYMDSIFLNLITNAIKYSHPDRKPVIDICTFTEDGHSHLLIKDNGIGIDLERHGKELFNMYQTFHHNKEAVGIGLFITKNQVETLQGSIEVESEVNVGTSFKISF